MCGINGFLYTKSSYLNRSLSDLILMNNCIIHRGPDSSGVFIENNDDYTVSMGMRRLSIIDLESGNQPIYSNDNTKVIVFNGEIYNHKYLRERLIAKGAEFKTNSDTEVILRLYELEGPQSFSLLDGMFAFSIYDKTLQKVFIARDFFGEKPLYYFASENSFIWSSELKSILSILDFKPEIDNYGLSLFLQLTYIPAPFTIFNGISKLEANCFLEIDCKDLNFSIKEITYSPKNFKYSSKKDAIRLTHDLVNESVISRSVSDVPLGTFLSGGVDSSIISLCLAQQCNDRINTFSIGFDKKSFDESEKARSVSKLINSIHHEFIVSEKDLGLNLDDVILNFDEPFADSSAIATFIVSKNSGEFVKVALTGDGGDELFGGYNKYFMGDLNLKYTSFISPKMHPYVKNIFNSLFSIKDDSRGTRFKISRFLNSVNYNDDFYYNIISLGFNEFELKNLIKKDRLNNSTISYFKDKFGESINGLSRFRAIDKLISLEGDMLVKVDRTSMLASIECRAPFLNKDLWSFTNQLPSSYLINGLDKKHILKEAFKGYFPDGFLNKSKKGFGVPVGDWLKTKLRQELLNFCDKQFIVKQNIFHYNYISELVNNHLEGKIDNSFKVWTFFCFQKWYRYSYEK